MNHNRILWILQWVFGLYFVGVGVLHLVVPEGLPGALEWMYDLNDTMHAITGVAEILGGLGLILPGLTRVRPELTVAAAVGLLLVMLGAIVWHFGREEFQNIGINVFNALVMAYIAYGRARLAPLSKDGAAVTT